MTEKQRNYFNSILAGIRYMTEEEKATFTGMVEADEDCKSLCISYAKALEKMMAQGKKKAVRHIEAWKSCDRATAFVANFVEKVYATEKGE